MTSRGDAHEDTEHGDADTAAGEAPAHRRGSADPLPRGAIVGRYVLLHQLGSGGMGIVYAAYDPELDRKIAVKVLHPIAAKTGLAGAVRLVREAQAMARIKHPNVVTVHDVGQEGGVLHLAMEFVDGHTLKGWLRAAPRSRAEIVQVFLSAGEGLRAAHDRGLVHRDFKPENVMIEAGGRVVVLDFGVAYAAAAEPTPIAGDDASSSTALGRADAHRTAAGAMVGTPAYMSPEQFAGEPPDARADQFAFCVALWEALAGARPFRGDSSPELAAAVNAEQILDPPRAADFPPWLRRVLARGLRAKRSERWPSMDALLAALRHDPTLRRRRIGISVLALAVVVGGAGAMWLDRRAERAACAQTGEEIGNVWSAAVRDEIAASMRATGSPYADDAFEKSVPWLDEWASAWSAARTRACEAELEQSDPEYTRAVVACLEERRSAFGEVVAALGETTAETIDRAVALSAGLPSVSRCSDRVWLLSRPTLPDDPAILSEIATARGRLDRADVLAGQGRREDALVLARSVLEREETRSWAPLHARALVTVGELLYDDGDYAASRTTLVDGFFAGMAARDNDLAGRAATLLLLTVGEGLGRSEEAEIWGRLAQAQIDTGADPLLRISLLSNRVAVSYLAGDAEQALALAHEAWMLSVDTYGADHPESLAHRVNRAAMLAEVGRLAEAEEQLRGCLLDSRRVLGEAHPDVAGVHNNLATTLATAGKLEEAEVEARKAVESGRALLGPAHPNTATALNTLAAVLEATGRATEAEDTLRSVVDVWSRAYGPRHLNVALARGNLGRAIDAQGRLAEAKKEYLDAIEIAVAEAGENHETVAGLRENLAATLQREGAREESLAEYRKVLEIRRATLPADHPHIAFAQTNLARALLALGRRDDARTELEHAWAMLQRVEAPAHERATTAWWLAQVLPDGARAIATAEQARRGFAESGDAGLEAQVAAWLAARGGAPVDSVPSGE